MALYNFTDIDRAATPGDLPGEALFINGAAIESQILGYRTLYAKGREALSADVELTEQGRANGSAFNYKRYPERVLTVGFQILANTNEEFRQKFNHLGSILNVEQAQIVFNDEPDKFFVGTPGEISEIEAGSNKIVGEFSIVCADPFKYSVEEKTLDVRPGIPKTIYYNGTMPATPTINAHGTLTPDNGQAMNLELFSINDKALVLFEDGDGGTYNGTLSEMETSTAGGWTAKEQHVTTTLDEFRAEGVIMYTRNTADAMYYARVYANMGQSYKPMIEIARDYTDGLPTSELRFWVGDKIVYRQSIDDFGSNLFRFRISFSHTSTAVAVADGQMTGNYFFQLGDITYSFRDSWTWNSGMSVDNTIRLTAVTRHFYYENDHAITNIGAGILWVWNKPIDKCGSQFPFNSSTIIDPSSGRLLVLGLNTPRFIDPANRLDDFKIMPGENVFKCSASGPATPSLFTATFKWREVFL